MFGKLKSLEEAAKRLYTLQLSLVEKGVFPVAGLLLDQKGNIIHQDVNKVLARFDGSVERCVRNPTAHGQMSVIGWYWANKNKFNLPQPSQLTIITTLDPCIMCTSSIIISGFNVGTITFDDVGGANWNFNRFSDFEFAPKYKEKLVQLFGYYAVSDFKNREKYQYQASKVYFKEDILSFELQDKMEKQFINARYVGREYRPLVQREKLINLCTLSQTQEPVRSLKQLSPQALSIKLNQRVKVNGVETPYFEPNQDLKAYLQALVKQTPQAKNAVALIDTFGNLLLARADQFETSPIATALLNASLQYSELYWTLANKDHQNKIPLQQSMTFQYLPPIQYCTFIFLNAMPGDQTASLQTVGLYAFCHNRLTPQGAFIYINDYEKDNKITLEDAIQHLPPLYRKGFYDVRPLLSRIGKQ